MTLNNVSPGLIRTERNAWRREPGGDWDEFSRTCSYAGRAGEPEEVASAVAMFCAPGASFVTGENLFVAGGAQIPGRREGAEDVGQERRRGPWVGGRTPQAARAAAVQRTRRRRWTDADPGRRIAALGLALAMWPAAHAQP